MREYLRERVDPAHVLRAVQRGLDSEDEKEQLTAARMLMAELGEGQAPPVESAGAEPVYDYKAIVDGLEEVGLLARLPLTLAAMSVGLPWAWMAADKTGRESFIDAVRKVSTDSG